MDGERFWIVWNPKSPRPPTYRHRSEESARDEAERLARLNPGQEFIVLGAVASVRVVDVQWTEYRTDADLPL